MNRHNVRVRATSAQGFIKKISKRKEDDQLKNTHLFTKVVMEKQSIETENILNQIK